MYGSYLPENNTQNDEIDTDAYRYWIYFVAV